MEATLYQARPLVHLALYCQHWLAAAVQGFGTVTAHPFGLPLDRAKIVYFPRFDLPNSSSPKMCDDWKTC